MVVLNFRVEYDRWPRVLDSEVSESPMELSSAALATLLNFPSPEAESDNPKKIIFWGSETVSEKSRRRAR